MNAVAFLIILALVLLAYAAPTLVAFQRGHPNRYLIAAINLVGGMTGFLWVVTLIWAFRAVHLSPTGDDGGESGLDITINDPIRATLARDKPAQLAQPQELLEAGHIGQQEHARLRAEILGSR